MEHREATCLSGRNEQWIPHRRKADHKWCHNIDTGYYSALSYAFYVNLVFLNTCQRWKKCAIDRGVDVVNNGTRNFSALIIKSQIRWGIEFANPKVAHIVISIVKKCGRKQFPTNVKKRDYPHQREGTIIHRMSTSIAGLHIY